MEVNLKQAQREADYRLECWNRFIDRCMDGTGYVDPGEREKVLLEWAEAENKVGELRRRSQPCQS